MTMPKRVIAVLWVAGTVIMVAGGWALLSVASQAKPGNSLHDHPVASITLLALCYSVTLTGVALGLVAWAGALASTYRLERKTWFHILLWLGTAGLAASPLVIGGVVWWGLMLIYLVGGPDRPAPPVPPQLAQPPARRSPSTGNQPDPLSQGTGGIPLTGHEIRVTSVPQRGTSAATSRDRRLIILEQAPGVKGHLRRFR
jgi:hypothetical protein